MNNINQIIVEFFEKTNKKKLFLSRFISEL